MEKKKGEKKRGKLVTQCFILSSVAMEKGKKREWFAQDPWRA